MSRLIAIAMLCVLALNAAPFALFAGPESALPACCRRGGKHHCAMMDMLEKQERDNGPSWRAIPQKCPLYPKSSVTFFSGHAATTPPPAAAVAGSPANSPISKAQTEVLYRISHNRARQKRGPPSSL